MANEPNKFFDVARPGNTAASAGSRPVIVGNQPVLQDPMMVNNPSDVEKPSDHKKIDLQPSPAFQSEEQAKDGVPTPAEHVTKHNNDAPIQSDEAQQEIEHLIDQKAHFVHIKGAKRKKYVVRFILIIGTLCTIAGVGYYVMTLTRK